MITIIIPIIYYGEYAIPAVQSISKHIGCYDNIDFLFVCSCPEVALQTKSILQDTALSPNCQIVTANNRSSNFLRGFAVKYVKTQFLYYQDCDDLVDYAYISEIVKIFSVENIYCFNIYRRTIDNNNNVIAEKRLYTLPENKQLTIQELPTNIVNKVIPTSLMSEIDFFNLPFSQDWSISFQLFRFVPHFFIDRDVYQYENNESSTAGIRKTKYNSLLRICVVEKYFQNLYKDNYADQLYLKYRYSLLLEGRFSFLGVPYFPKYKFDMFNLRYFSLKDITKHVYHFCHSIINYMALKFKHNGEI